MVRRLNIEPLRRCRTVCEDLDWLMKCRAAVRAKWVGVSIRHKVRNVLIERLLDDDTLEPELPGSPRPVTCWQK